MDVDADGRPDILSGCYSVSGHEVMVGLFHVLRGQEDGSFAAAEALTGTDGELLMVHHELTDRAQQLTENICTRPFAVDWDGDADLDLVVGNFKGTFFVFSGEGAGSFLPRPTALTSADGAVMRTAGAHSDPFVVDWDGDGDLDLLATSHTGEIQWAENQALDGADDADLGKAIPAQLAAFQTLIAPTPAAGPAGSTRIHVEDVNGDGKLDVLVGDTVTIDGTSTGQVWLYLQK